MGVPRSRRTGTRALDVPAPRYVYRRGGSSSTYWDYAHRVMRATARFLYVEVEIDWHETTGGEHPPVVRTVPSQTVRLDRIELERDGETRSRSPLRHGRFYLERTLVEETPIDSELADALERLGASADDWPMSRDELRAAYRRRVLAAHPDQGGTADAFRAVLDAYETALERLGGGGLRKAIPPTPTSGDAP